MQAGRADGTPQRVPVRLADAVWQVHQGGGHVRQLRTGKARGARQAGAKGRSGAHWRGGDGRAQGPPRRVGGRGRRPRAHADRLHNARGEDEQANPGQRHTGGRGPARGAATTSGAATGRERGRCRGGGGREGGTERTQRHRPPDTGRAVSGGEGWGHCGRAWQPR
eukprot:1086603-Pleurochrysis_carterae.AAC.1